MAPAYYQGNRFGLQGVTAMERSEIVTIEEVITNDTIGPVQKVCLLRDELEFWYVNVYNYRHPELCKFSPPLLGKQALAIFDECIGATEVFYS